MAQLSSEAKAALVRQHLDDGVPLTRLAAAAGLPVHTVRRWAAVYRTDPTTAKLQRQPRSDVGRRRLPEDLIQAIEGIALRRPPPTTTYVHRRVADLARDRGVPAPSYITAAIGELGGHPPIEAPPAAPFLGTREHRRVRPRVPAAQHRGTHRRAHPPLAHRRARQQRRQVHLGRRHRPDHRRQLPPRRPPAQPGPAHPADQPPRHHHPRSRRGRPRGSAHRPLTPTRPTSAATMRPDTAATHSRQSLRPQSSVSTPAQKRTITRRRPASRSHNGTWSERWLAS